MAIVTQRFTTSWRDAKGFIGKTLNYVTGDNTSDTYEDDVRTVVVTLADAILNLTNAAYQGDSGLTFNDQQDLAYGTNATYTAEWMKAVFTFTTAEGTIHRFKIPAPELDIFEADGVTVKNDGTQADVVAYINAMKTAVNGVFISSKAGEPFDHFVGGILKFGQQPRRFNQFIKSATLVAGEGE